MIYRFVLELNTLHYYCTLYNYYHFFHVINHAKIDKQTYYHTN